MEYSPSQHIDFRTSSRQQQSRRQTNMSIVTMATPSPYHIFNHNLRWDMPRPSSDAARPRTESKHIALPSIRQTFPDLYLEGSLVNVASDHPSYFKPSPPTNAGSLASPEYVHSPSANKKRRISNEDEQEFSRAKQIPRLYRSPEVSQRRPISPHQDQPPPLAAKEHWPGGPIRSNGYGAGIAELPPPIETNSHYGQRPGPSSLSPTLQFGRDNSAMPRPGEHMVELVNVPRATASNHGTPAVMERPPLHSQSQEYGYSYHHPSRYQSLSTSSIRPHDRALFSAGAAYGSHYQDMGRYGNTGMGGDAKQRKRRGNLPKETTDKLRAWFIAHLQHPYPTEDEKQDLMRQTGLQMNQISNWFINARRRQLPTMISNARAESEVMNSRSSGSNNADGSVLTSTEYASDYGGKRDDGLPLSDSEGGAYDEDMDTLRRRIGGNLERESV